MGTYLCTYRQQLSVLERRAHEFMSGNWWRVVGLGAKEMANGDVSLCSDQSQHTDDSCVSRK